MSDAHFAAWLETVWPVRDVPTPTTETLMRDFLKTLALIALAAAMLIAGLFLTA